MIKPSDRLSKLRAALRAAFEPTQLELVDDTESHRGHAGYQTGKGHFKLTIASASLEGLARIEQHRRIYAALGSLMETDIHALNITVTDFIA